MKKKISTIAVISVFSIIILLCLISIVSQKITEHNEKAEFEKLAGIVTEEITDATIEETIKKPNILKVSDSDDELQTEQPVYYTTY